MTARSAFRLAARPDAEAFAEAWNLALPLARRGLLAIARSYAVNGVPEQVWRDGVLVAERRRPSERLLIYLLDRLDPVRIGRQHAPEGDDEAARAAPGRRLGELLEWFEDIEDEPEPDDLPARADARRGATFDDLSRPDASAP